MLRRLYGPAWDAAPPALRLAVTAVVASGVLGVVLTAVALGREPDGSAGLAVAGVLFVALLTGLVVALCALLLRRDRLVWSLLVLLHVGSLAAVPRDGLEVAGSVLTAVTLVALLLPGVLRAVWTGRSRSAVAPDLRRPD